MDINTLSFDKLVPKDSKYLTQADVGEDGVDLTIRGFKQESVKGDHGDETKVVLHFLETGFKPMILNQTNSKRIGIAKSDETRIIATPKLIINRSSNLKDFAKISELINEYQAAALVVGYPVNMDGSTIEMSQFAQKFAENLNEFLENKFAIFLFEERLSSFEARTLGYNKISRNHKSKFIDDIAASIILQHFLDEFCQSTY